MRTQLSDCTSSFIAIRGEQTSKWLLNDEGMKTSWRILERNDEPVTKEGFAIVTGREVR